MFTPDAVKIAKAAAEKLEKDLFKNHMNALKPDLDYDERVLNM